ncbi:MAG TPA: hypothetical protein VNU95_00815 [Candidatus Acidoferrales bacterium]|nr:hypothetical protein [Candidatus Acidoferrales bacterium]
MKTTELKTLWKLVKAGEKRSLSAADLRLLTRVRSALMDYEDEVKLGHTAPERRCMICKEPLNQCRC